MFIYLVTLKYAIVSSILMLPLVRHVYIAKYNCVEKHVIYLVQSLIVEVWDM